MKILLISGHGAGDPGACATIGGVQYKEAEETRRVVNLLRPMLADYAQVGVYDQRRDAFGDAKAGTLAAKLKGWDYVLEIHFNAGAGDKGGNGRTTGTEILSPTGCGWSGAEGSIMRELAALGFANRGRKEQALAVIGTAYRQGCKANLIEVCFVDDADDMRLYTANSKAVAEAICRGVVSAFGLEEVDNMVRYNRLSDVPEGEFRTAVDNLMTAGIIGGDGSDKTGNNDVIDLSKDMVRILVFEYRAGVYDNALTAAGISRV